MSKETTNDYNEQSSELPNGKGQEDHNPKKRASASGADDITLSSSAKKNSGTTPSLDLENALTAMGVKLPNLTRGISQRLSGDVTASIPADLVEIRGMRTIRAILHDLTVQAHNMNMTLPVGDIRDLPASIQEKVSTYMDLICLRVSAIPDTSQLRASVMAFVDKDLLDEKWLETPFDDGKKSQGDSLAGVYESAVRRYISMQVISPLLRSVLVSRLGIKGVQRPDVIDWAFQYAGWLRDADKGLLRSALKANIISDLETNPKIAPYLALSEALLGGVNTPSYIGLPKLLGAISDHHGGLAKAYTFGTTEEGFEITNPLLSQTREVLAYDCANRPVAFTDFLEVDVPTMNTEDVVYVLKMAATLNGVDIEKSIGLEFMAQHPKWSGYLLTDLTEHRPTEEFMNWLTAMLNHKYLVYMTTLPNVDKTLTALFDEPNRADLHITSIDKLYYIALAHRVLNETLADVIACINSSAEFAGTEAISEVIKLAPDKLSGGMVPRNDWKLHREFKNTNTTVFIKNRSVISSVYHIDQDMSAFHPIMRTQMKALLNQHLVGTMETYNIMTKSIAIPDVMPVCLLSNMHMQSFLNTVGASVSIVTREALAARIGVDVSALDDLSVKWIKRRNTADSADIAIIADIKPVIVSYNTLRGLDKLGLSVVKTPSAAFDLLSYYLGFSEEDEVRIFTSDTLIHFKELDTKDIDIESFILTKDVAAAIKPLLKPWAYDFEADEISGDGTQN